MLPNAKDIQPDLIGQLDLLEQFLNSRHVTRRTGTSRGDKTIDADLQGLRHTLNTQWKLRHHFRKNANP